MTGATGHVGNNLVRALISRGRNVRSLIHIKQAPIDNIKTEIVKADIGDIKSLYKAFDNADIVYHLAGHISISMHDWSTCESINVEGTRNVVDACLRCNVKRLVYFSSIHAFASPSENSSIEDFSQLIDSDKCAPYDRSKALAERYVKNKIDTDGLNAVIISPTGIIGPFDYKPSYFGKVLLLLAKRKLPVILDGGFNWVDVRDVVDGAITAEEISTAGSKYILSGHWASIPEIAEIISHIIGVRAPELTIPEVLAKAAVPFSNFISRITKKDLCLSGLTVQSLYSRWSIYSHNAITDLNYKPRPLTESLQDALQWFIENGYLTHSKVMPYRENN